MFVVSWHVTPRLRGHVECARRGPRRVVKFGGIRRRRRVTDHEAERLGWLLLFRRLCSMTDQPRSPWAHASRA